MKVSGIYCTHFETTVEHYFIIHHDFDVLKDAAPTLTNKADMAHS